MSVDFFWRRIPATVAESASADELAALFPGWFSEAFDPLFKAGLIMGVERHGYLMDVVLTAAGPADDAARHLPVFGGTLRTGTVADDADEGVEILTLTPAETADAARFLRAFSIQTAVRSLEDTLVREADGVGLRWDDDLPDDLVRDLRELRDFFDGAAQDGDAVVKFESA